MQLLGVLPDVAHEVPEVVFTLEDVEQDDLLEVLDLLLEGRHFGLEFGYWVLGNILEIEIVIVTVNRVIIESVEIIITMLFKSEGSNFLEVVGPT